MGRDCACEWQYFTCDIVAYVHVPQIASKVGLLSSVGDGDAPDPLCGKNCVELVHHIPVECAEAYSHFLTSLILTELKEVQRGVVYAALREVQVPSQAERALQAVKEALPSLCSANLNRDVKSVGLIKGQFLVSVLVVGRKSVYVCARYCINMTVSAVTSDSFGLDPHVINTCRLLLHEV